MQEIRKILFFFFVFSGLINQNYAQHKQDDYCPVTFSHLTLAQSDTTKNPPEKSKMQKTAGKEATDQTTKDKVICCAKHGGIYKCNKTAGYYMCIDGTQSGTCKCK